MADEALRDVRAGLVTLATAISLVMYVPLWRRMVRRRTTGDFSKTTQWLIVALQCLGWSIAWLDGARTLYTLYYPLQLALVLTTLVLIYKYYD